LNVLGNEKLADRCEILSLSRYKHYIHKAGDYIGVLRYIDLYTQKKEFIETLSLSVPSHCQITSMRCPVVVLLPTFITSRVSI